MARNAEATRERILDAAEYLFARKGFDGVTVRQIMSRAEADVALAYYHFKNKADLFDAVLLRRVETLNAIRLARLEEVERRHPNDPASVEDIVGAFTTPLLEVMADDPDEWRDYMALIAQINNSPERGGQLMTRFFDPLVNRFLDALRRVLPGCRDEDLYWCHHFMSGALTLTFAATGRLDNLSGGKVSSADVRGAAERMPAFLAAGFHQVCGKQPSE